MTLSEEQIRSAVAQQAGEWFVANQAGGLSHQDRAAFVAWFKASPIHVEEYLGVALIASDLKVAADASHPPLEELIKQARFDPGDVVPFEPPTSLVNHVGSRQRAPQLWPLAAAAALLLGVGASVIWWRHDGALLGLPKTYRTVHGAQLVQRLPDGSEFQLDTDSAVTVRYSGHERLVDLDRGQALFQVMHDGTRPFRVMAGHTATIALGTRFNVYRKVDSTIVTVAEGRVAVVSRVGNRPMSAEALSSDARRVEAGYQLRIDAGGRSAQPIAVDLLETLGWVRHKIVFERRPLGEVADEFNRYGRVRLEIDDAALRALPVSGVFDINDAESFATFLSRLDGVIVDRSAIRIRVTRRAEGQEPITTAR